MAIRSKGKKNPRVEFKCEDEAWYDVSLKLKDSSLKVHYEGFSHEWDELLQLKEFKGVEDVRSRFRLSSVQLQDQQCWKVIEGMVVCVSCSSDGEDNRFFDAIVEKVCQSEHHVVEGEEQCTCTFEVSWLAGPNANERTTVSCENICLLTAGVIETHPVINAFVKLVEEQMDGRTRSVGRNPLKRKVATLESGLHVPGSFSTNFESTNVEPGQTTMDGESTRDLRSDALPSKDDSFSNLKKLNERRGSSFKTVEEAFSNATEGPSPHNLKRSRRNLFNERMLQRKFLLMRLRCLMPKRPWVVCHLGDGELEGTFGDFTLGSKGMQPSWMTTSFSKVRVVYRGTGEYDEAKMRKNTFLEFREHVMLLHKRLAHEESRFCSN